MQSIIRIKILLLSCLFFIGFKGFSQNPETYLKMIQEEYPEDNFVQLNKNIHYSIFIKKGELKIKVKEIEKYIYLKNVKSLPITLSTYSSTFNELIEFEAISYIPNGAKYKEIEVKDYNEKMNVGNSAFYDDVRELNFTYPGISEGTIIELSTIHILHEPRLINKVYLNTFIPIREFNFSVDYDKNIDLEIIKYNLPEKGIDIIQSEDRKTNTYSCLVKNLGKKEFENFQPDLSYFLPHFIPKINSYRYENNQFDVLSNINSLYKWYSGFIIDLINNNKSNDELTNLVKSITENCNSELEKVENIYYWVQENIKYIAFEDAMGGFVPRDPYLTFNNKYGDCKDKSAILYEMLRIAGIESYFTWIGTYDIPYTYDKVPTPISDNHMIITYINNENYYFLDGTSEYLNIDYPSVFIQGKEALIAKTESEHEIKKVPVVSSEKNKTLEVITLEIKDNDLIGRGTCMYTGYYKSDLQYGLYLKNKQEQKKYVEAGLEKGNNKFVLNEYSILNLNTFSPELNIEYDFVLNNYLNKVDNNLYINLNFNRNWLLFKIKKDRKNPLFLRYNTLVDQKYILKIPKGYDLDYLPNNSNYESDNYKYSISYTYEQGEIVYTQKINVDTLFVDTTQFEEWNKFIKGLENAYKQTILLKKNEN